MGRVSEPPLGSTASLTGKVREKSLLLLVFNSTWFWLGLWAGNKDLLRSSSVGWANSKWCVQGWKGHGLGQIDGITVITLSSIWKLKMNVATHLIFKISPWKQGLENIGFGFFSARQQKWCKIVSYCVLFSPFLSLLLSSFPWIICFSSFPILFSFPKENLSLAFCLSVCRCQDAKLLFSTAPCWPQGGRASLPLTLGNPRCHRVLGDLV